MYVSGGLHPTRKTTAWNIRHPTQYSSSWPPCGWQIKRGALRRNWSLNVFLKSALHLARVSVFAARSELSAWRDETALASKASAHAKANLHVPVWFLMSSRRALFVVRSPIPWVQVGPACQHDGGVQAQNCVKEWQRELADRTRWSGVVPCLNSAPLQCDESRRHVLVSRRARVNHPRPHHRDWHGCAVGLLLGPTRVQSHPG